MPKGHFNPKNGSEVVDYVKGKPGVELHQKRDGRIVIKNAQGSMNIYDNKKSYSEPDKSHVRRMLKLLGLLCLVAGIPLCLWMQYVQYLRGG